MPGFKLYDRPNSPFWWVYFTITGHPKPYRISTRIKLASRGEAEKKAAELFLGRFSTSTATAVPDAVRALDVKQLSELWIAELEKDRSSKFVERISCDMAGYIEKQWTHPSQITTESWERLTWDPKTRAAGVLHHSKKGPLKWRSISHLANTLRHFLRFCASKGVIDSVPEIRSPPLKLQEQDRAPRAALDEEKREKFLGALVEMGELRAHRIYTTLFETWVRKSTLEKMTQRWIDWKAETITLPPLGNKSGKEKTIDLTPRAAAAIKAQLAANAAARKPDEPVPMEEPIFGHFDFHHSWDERHNGGLFGRALAKAGIDKHGLTPHHSTRHSALTIAGQQPNATLSGMMAQSGIDSANIIEKHYLHPSLEDARRITRS